MLVENPSVNRGELAELISCKFDGAGDSLEFVPLGEDSWSYRFGLLWVSVRRDFDGHHPGAYEAATEMRSRGMSFVISPLVGRDGRVVHHLRGLPVVVFPHVESARTASADSTDDGLADQLITLLETVHRASVCARVPVEDFTVPFDGALAAALHRACDAGDPQGPCSEKLAKLVARNWDYISQLRAATAEMAQACAADRGELMLTHGDPSPANVVPAEPVLSILDWGGLKWAPAERDWAAMRRDFGRSPRCAPHRLRFYELRWALSEITEYVTRFTRPHHGDPDDQAMWQRLGNYLPER